MLNSDITQSQLNDALDKFNEEEAMSLIKATENALEFDDMKLIDVFDYTNKKITVQEFEVKIRNLIPMQIDQNIGFGILNIFENLRNNLRIASQESHRIFERVFAQIEYRNIKIETLQNRIVELESDIESLNKQKEIEKETNNNSLINTEKVPDDIEQTPMFIGMVDDKIKKKK